MSRNLIQVRAAQASDLAQLAAPLAAQPLLQAYGATAAGLLQRWAAAQAAGESLQVVLGAEPDVPLGLSWWLPRGTFALGAYLRYLAVLEGATGQGLGLALLHAYERGAAGPAGEAPVGGWFLLCSDFNARAQAFYRRQGYTQVGSLPDFVRPGIAEQIFWKPRPRTG